MRTERAGEVVRRLDRPLNIVDVQMLCTGSDGADALVVLTEWNEFRAISPDTLAQRIKGRVIVDLRNVFDPSAMSAAGFTYLGSGRRAS